MGNLNTQHINDNHAAHLAWVPQVRVRPFCFLILYVLWTFSPYLTRPELITFLSVMGQSQLLVLLLLLIIILNCVLCNGKVLYFCSLFSVQFTSHKTLFAQFVDALHLLFKLQSHGPELDEIHWDECPTYWII